jgi:putative membrane protein
VTIGERGMRYFPHAVLTAYLLLFTICAVSPHDRATWWAENIPILVTVAVVVALYRRLRFSNTAVALMSVLVFLHTIGGHYTFERVPFGFVTDLFGFERNHFDRMAHFTVGFYAFALAEVLWRFRLVRSVWIALVFPVTAIFTVASLYEILEWQYAVIEGGASGAAFLGSQGDVWDAQKDMLADALGAVVAVVVFWLVHRKTLAADLASGRST